MNKKKPNFYQIADAIRQELKGKKVEYTIVWQEAGKEVCTLPKRSDGSSYPMLILSWIRNPHEFMELLKFTRVLSDDFEPSPGRPLSVSRKDRDLFCLMWLTRPKNDKARLVDYMLTYLPTNENGTPLINARTARIWIAAFRKTRRGARVKRGT